MSTQYLRRKGAKKEPNCISGNFTKPFHSLGTPVQACGFLLFPRESGNYRVVYKPGRMQQVECCAAAEAGGAREQHGGFAGTGLREGQRPGLCSTSCLARAHPALTREHGHGHEQQPCRTRSCTERDCGTRLWAMCHRRRPRTGASAPPQVRQPLVPRGKA